MYKITVCNLGYENENLSNLDGKTGELETLIKKIKRIKPQNAKTIESHKITNINYNITENDFKKEDVINVIETDDFDRCIYIRKLD